MLFLGLLNKVVFSVVKFDGCQRMLQETLTLPLVLWGI